MFFDMYLFIRLFIGLLNIYRVSIRFKLGIGEELGGNSDGYYLGFWFL